MTQSKQLNAFELKQFVLSILNNYNSEDDLDEFERNCEVLDSQEDTKLITKILLKELVASDVQRACIICSILLRYNNVSLLIDKFWEILKQPGLNLQVKVQLINFIRDNDSNWTYETCEEQLGDSTDILDENTRQMLEHSVSNPELQIDFMDFLSTLSVNDKLALLHSLEDDFSNEGLANILMFLILSDPKSSVSELALKLLSETKSPLAFYALNQLKNIINDNEILRKIKKHVTELKLQGFNEHKTLEYFKNLLSDSAPEKFHVTYPDGHGNIALIFTRITKNNNVRFVSIVANLETGIRDCFGFYEISRFEADKVFERFFKNEKAIELEPGIFVSVLKYLEINNKFDHYEYLCWKTLLGDIEIKNTDIARFVEEKLTESTDLSLVEDVFNSDFCERWYLDENYNEEFKNRLQDLPNFDNLDFFVERNFEYVFNEYEDDSAKSRLLLGAYIKLNLNDHNSANKLYTLLKNKDLRYNLYKQIFKRSIYEYLTLIKYDSDRNIYNFTHDNIKKYIDFIEENWCTK